VSSKTLWRITRSDKMMMKTLIILCTLVISIAVSADTPDSAHSQIQGFAVWSAKQLHDSEKTLHANIGGPARNANIKFADFGASATQIGRREGRSLVELHDHLDDYFVVQGGAATLVVGGEMQNGHPTDPGETRGDSIKGGERYTLSTGDIVHIPAKIPHQLLVDEGKHFTYFVIKVKIP
jgi:mannose-6-phosphate isomerase-like protein (cupin superfamily)